MPVKCKICDREFASLITSTHLKSHNISTSEYKATYGKDALTSSEYRAKRSADSSGSKNANFGNKMSEESKKKISNKNKGKPPHNKGVKLEGSELERAQHAVMLREERYNSGELTRKTIQTHTEETKIKISDSVKQYANHNAEEMRRRGAQSVQTKRQRGYDFSLNAPSNHSDETKEKISNSLKKSNKIRRDKTFEIHQQRLSDHGFKIEKLSDTLFSITCDNGHTFLRSANVLAPSKFSKTMCDICHPRVKYSSIAEDEIYEFVTKYTTAIQSNRSILHRKEIDILCEQEKVAIEYNGLYWHSENVLAANGYIKTKDNVKYNEILSAGYRPIVIYEDEWINKTDICKSRILSILGKQINRIYARKTKVKELSSAESSKFLRENHLQGNGRSNKRYGLYYNNELVSVMTFSSSNISKNITGWELNRFANKTFTTVIGGASKLLKRFINDVNPEKIISYADRRWSDGGLYETLGFDQTHISPPNYWYLKPNDLTRYHRFGLRKTKEDDQNLTEWENRKIQGLNRIWDCGNYKYVWER